MTQAAEDHTRQVIEQFSRQAVYFEKLPSHEEATTLLLRMAGVSATDVVLDVACGAGAVACPAARVAARVTGIDVTPTMIERAAAQQAALGLENMEWHVGDVAELPFEEGRFDVVLTRYSVHHFLRLAEMGRVCKPSGHIAVADLVLPADKAAAYDRMERLRDPSHVCVLTESQLGDLLAAAGLADLRWARYLFELELDALLQASFPQPGDANRVRAMIEADVGVNDLGIDARQCGDSVRISYPIAIVVGTKPAA